jgi:arabinofuranosyltransferase
MKAFNRYAFLLLLVGIASHIALGIIFDFTQDDAYITFRYATNFVNGEGLVYNAGERIEGYTNFLWTIIMVLARLGHLDLSIFSRVLGICLGIGSILVLFSIGRRIFGPGSLWPGVACLLAGMNYSFAYWSVAGLETAAFTLTVLTSLYFYMKRSYLAPWLLALATLLRPEGAMVFAFVIIYEFIRAKDISRFLVGCLVVYSILILPFIAFKLHYYGSLIPNPFFAKTDFGLQALLDGTAYTAVFFWHYFAGGAFLVPLVLAFHRRNSSVSMILSFVILYTLYIIIVGGDALKVHRFFVPVLPLLTLLVLFGLTKAFANKMITAVLAVMLLLWQMAVPYHYVQTYHQAEKGLTLKMMRIGENLKKTDSSRFSLAASTIGMIGFSLLGHDVIDMLGLTDSTIARHPEPASEGITSTWRENHYNARYLLSREPDYILFSTGQKPSAPAEKSLFLYSQFLRNYRTIAFFLGGKFQDVFKRFGDIDGDIRRDLSPEFVRTYSRAVSLQQKGDYSEAEAQYNATFKYVPDSLFPYARYYMAECRRLMGDYYGSYMLLNEVIKHDTMTYQAYKDLFIYEHEFYKNYDKADRYRRRIASLIPWYLPILDADAGKR